MGLAETENPTDVVFGAQTTAQGAAFCRLELVRLADDSITTRFVNGHVAQIDVQVTTVPRLTP